MASKVIGVIATQGTVKRRSMFADASLCVCMLETVEECVCVCVCVRERERERERRGVF
jgi:hypothetical protein